MVVVNKRKSLRLKNRTKYFSPDTTRSHVRFSSPESYQSRQIKIEGYETRLYWQFRYCEEHHGQTFFYTLTYNDAHLPKHYGINCFDYEDLRDLFTGGFRKRLLRKYGTTFKYFVGAELGDGKGSRGMHNNPHYHVLFFLEPAKDDRYDYVPISSEDFRHLVRLYWQGFDEAIDGYRDYNEALYGIAREGENVGKVTDYRAINYVAKYVCKDAQLKRQEVKVERTVRYREKQRAKKSTEVFAMFFHDVVYPLYNTPLNASGTKWLYDDKQLFVQLIPDTFKSFTKMYGEVPDSVISIAYSSHVQDVIRKYQLWNKYDEFLDAYVSDKVNEALSEWRNRYSNKCRISQGVGDYALQFIGDKLNPTFQVPCKKGFKNRPMSQYYYRKLFTDVIVPTEESPTGKVRTYAPIRVLNDDGIRYKVNKLDERIRKMAGKARNNLALVLDNEVLYEKMKASDINTEVFMSHSEFLRTLDRAREENVNIFQRYAEYKLVYEDRFFRIPSLGDDDVFDFPCIDVRGDYARFLIPSVYSVSRSDLRLDAFLDSNCEDYLPYSQHPHFLRYISLFAVLDMCADYWFIQGDVRAQREAEEIAATKRFHSQRKLKEFYSQFK